MSQLYRSLMLLIFSLPCWSSAGDLSSTLLYVHAAHLLINTAIEKQGVIQQPGGGHTEHSGNTDVVCIDPTFTTASHSSSSTPDRNCLIISNDEEDGSRSTKQPVCLTCQARYCEPGKNYCLACLTQNNPAFELEEDDHETESKKECYVCKKIATGLFNLRSQWQCSVCSARECTGCYEPFNEQTIHALSCGDTGMLYHEDCLPQAPVRCITCNSFVSRVGHTNPTAEEPAPDITDEFINQVQSQLLAFDLHISTQIIRDYYQSHPEQVHSNNYDPLRRYYLARRRVRCCSIL